MASITNPIFTQTEKRHLEFVLQYPFPERDRVTEQLNHLKEHELQRDYTPYFRILQFRPNGANAGSGAMSPCIRINVLHADGTAPTEFTLYQRNALVFELEIYNADSSPMNLSSIMAGEVLLFHPRKE